MTKRNKEHGSYLFDIGFTWEINELPYHLFCNIVLFEDIADKFIMDV